VARLPEGFSHFVTSMTAPIASGWSVAGWDSHPLESAAFSRRTPVAVLQSKLERPLSANVSVEDGVCHRPRGRWASAHYSPTTCQSGRWSSSSAQRIGSSRTVLPW
jgi:hypothetical protein